MASNLAIRDTWVVRVLRALKLVDVNPDGQVAHSAGADFIPNAPSTPAYDPLASLSSMAAFPWVYAAVSALATDASSVGLIVQRGEGAEAEPADDHPLAQLLHSPSSRVPGVLFWRQVVTDLVLTGDAFILVAGKGQPEALLRLHPSRVRILPQPDGQPGAYEYTGGGDKVQYTYDQVLHIRTPSWADDPRSLWGVGAIQSLHNDLMTDKRTQELTASSAQTGRPTGIISPSEEGDRWSSEQIRLLRNAYEKQMTSGSGLLVMGGALQYTPVGWSPKDMEFAAVREMTRSAVLAALDVPPTRVGLPSANYATSKEQAKRYWEGIKGRLALVASELNRLAAMFPDGEGLTVHWDFSEVEALQESRSDRVSRVMTWVSMGVPVADAAAYEGFDDLPTDNLLDPYGMPTAEPEAEPEDEAEAEAEAEVEPPTEVEASMDNGVAEWLCSDLHVCEDLTSKDAKAEYMRKFLTEFHTPYERALNLAVRRHLAGRAARTAKRLADALPTNKGMNHVVTRADLGLGWLLEVLASYTESALLKASTRPILTKMVRQAIARALAQAEARGERLSPEWVDNQVRLMVDDMAGNMEAATKDMVKNEIELMLAQDATIGEMQDALMKSVAFTPERALRVARTETTKAVNTATRRTYDELANRGIELEIFWLASPGARDSHALLGQSDPIMPGEKFVIPSGEHAGKKATHPGGFGVAGLDINCRCTISSRVKK